MVLKLLIIEYRKALAVVSPKSSFFILIIHVRLLGRRSRLFKQFPLPILHLHMFPSSQNATGPKLSFLLVFELFYYLSVREVFGTHGA